MGSGAFLIIAPGFVAGIVPYWISRWRFGVALGGRFLHSPSAAMAELILCRVAAIVLLVIGLLCFWTASRDSRSKDWATPAPVFPPRHLVVTGLYRYVRNPMYVAVLSLVVGQGLLFSNLPVLEYGVLVWVIFSFWVVVYLEPTLRATSGDEYRAFCADVPRWIPRVRPWRGRADSTPSV